MARIIFFTVKKLDYSVKKPQLFFSILSVLLASCSQEQPPVPELSGLAPVTGQSGYFWAHNDGPNTPDSKPDDRIYRINSSGDVVQTVIVLTDNQDWEDIAPVVYDNNAHLLLADTGDNRQNRGVYSLHLLPEPIESTSTITPTKTIRFRYPDGASLDCESAAFDPLSDSVILVSKREAPPRVFRIPLHTDADMVITAEAIESVTGLQHAGLWEVIRHPFQGRYAAQPTALSISADGKIIALLTYKSVYVWRRTNVTLFDSAPTVIELPTIAQWEALAIDDGTLVVASEGRSQMVRLKMP